MDEKDNNALFCQTFLFLFYMKYTSSEKQRYVFGGSKLNVNGIKCYNVFY